MFFSSHLQYFVIKFYRRTLDLVPDAPFVEKFESENLAQLIRFFVFLGIYLRQSSCKIIFVHPQEHLDDKRGATR